eukprot:gene1763-biopygen1322
MSEHLVYETDNSCGAIVGVTADAMAAVQCSLDVKKAVSELNPATTPRLLRWTRTLPCRRRQPPCETSASASGWRRACARVRWSRRGWAVTKFRGRCVTEATQIATGVAGPRIAASESMVRPERAAGPLGVFDVGGGAHVGSSCNTFSTHHAGETSIL